MAADRNHDTTSTSDSTDAQDRKLVNARARRKARQAAEEQAEESAEESAGEQAPIPTSDREIADEFFTENRMTLRRVVSADDEITLGEDGTGAGAQTTGNRRGRRRAMGIRRR